MFTAPVTPTSDAWACPARKRARVICVAAFMMSFALYAASPFVTLWTIASFVSTRDMTALGQTINWSSLDASLKEQVMDGLHLGPAAQPVDDLPEFGSSFATSVVSNAVDLTINQKNLGHVVDEAIAAAPGAVHGGQMVAALTHAVVRFTSASSFEAQVALPGHENETPLRIQLRIEGWKWKLTRVDLPAPASHPVMEASITQRHA